MFAKILHNVAESTLIFLTPLNDQPIRCPTPEQSDGVVNFDFCKKPPKLIGYYSNVLWLPQKLCQFCNVHT